MVLGGRRVPTLRAACRRVPTLISPTCSTVEAADVAAPAATLTAFILNVGYDLHSC